MSQTTVTTTQDAPRIVTLDTGATVVVNSQESTSLEKIPIIDVARIFSDRLEDRQAVAEEVRNAARNIGFFYIVNHVCENQSFSNVNQLTVGRQGD
jgi:hypothetical protein